MRGCQKRDNRKDDVGFTLIELLIIVAIIGILAAIAIPQFAVYRTRTLNASAVSDLKNAVTAQEAYHQSHQIYCSTLATLTGSNYGLYLTKGVQIQILATSITSYTMTAYHTSGNKTYHFTGPWGKISLY